MELVSYKVFPGGAVGLNECGSFAGVLGAGHSPVQEVASDVMEARHTVFYRTTGRTDATKFSQHFPRSISLGFSYHVATRQGH